jgi:hypothetical protein
VLKADKLATSCADCFEIWEPHPPGTLWVCPGLLWDYFTFTLYCIKQVSVAARSTESMGSNPTEGVDVCCECCVLSGKGLCDELITRPEETYRLWCIVVCDLETS